MTTQTKKPSSIFPDYPREQPIIKKDGSLTSTWDLSLNSLYQALQSNFSNEGILFPQLDANDISTIQSIYNPSLIGSPLPQNIPDISGKTVFDSTNRVPKQFIITYDGSGNILTAAWKTFILT
jgi:hypothetical protein